MCSSFCFARERFIGFISATLAGKRLWGAYLVFALTIAYAMAALARSCGQLAAQICPANRLLTHRCFFAVASRVPATLSSADPVELIVLPTRTIILPLNQPDGNAFVP